MNEDEAQSVIEEIIAFRKDLFQELEDSDAAVYFLILQSL
jgi:hypothetical protein